MKRLLSLVAFFATVQASAQQVNPVPDYVFRNQMSVGRNAVTDTAAYFSIGPRYGATKGFMPPIVGDTATFSSGKRNGLLIFSVQKNKFLYWDSVRVQWSDMAGGSGSYILAGDTSAMLAPYLRKADTTAMLSPYYRSATASAALALKLNISDTSSMLGNYIRHAGYGLTKSGQSFLVDTLNIATRAWRQKGIDSVVSIIPAAGVGGSGTTNRIAKFTASGTLGNGSIADSSSSVAMTILSSGNIGIGTTSPGSILDVRSSGYNIIRSTGGNGGYFDAYNTSGTRLASFGAESGGDVYFGSRGSSPVIAITNSTERLRIFANGRVFVGASPTDAGYQLDVNGTLRSVNGANFATTSGNVGIGTASPSQKLEVAGNISVTGVAGGTRYIIVGDATNTYTGALNLQAGGGSGTWGGGIVLYGNSHATYPGGVWIGNSQGASGPIMFGSGGIGPVSEFMRLTGAGELLVNTQTDAGDYKLQVSGNIYNTSSAVLAATSGGVAIGTTTTSGKLNILGDNDQININTTGTWSAIYFKNAGADRAAFYVNNTAAYIEGRGTSGLYLGGAGATAHVNLNANGELIIGTGASDAGDYKLQVSGNIYNTGSAVLAATSGEVLVGTTTDRGAYKFQADGLSFFGSDANSYTLLNNTASNAAMQAYGAWTNHLRMTYPAVVDFDFQVTASGELDLKRSSTVATRVNTAREFMINTTTDAGDYHLQVVGNARIGTGKLDIASNTTFGLGVARSGTSEVAGQIYNSNGILYLGAESSAGGQIFSGSSAYAGVIGTGANYPLQFAVNNITRGGFSTSGNLLLGFTTDSYFLKLQVNGSIFSNNQFFGQGVNAQLSIDSSTNISPLYVSAHSLTGTSAQAMLYSNTTWNTTGNPSLLDLNVTNTASGATSNYIKITDGTNTFRVTKAAEVVTAAPTGGSIRKWKLGEAATVSPTSPNRTIRVEIDGTVYYLHAKTTND